MVKMNYYRERASTAAVFQNKDWASLNACALKVGWAAAGEARLFPHACALRRRCFLGFQPGSGRKRTCALRSTASVGGGVDVQGAFSGMRRAWAGGGWSWRRRRARCWRCCGPRARRTCPACCTGCGRAVSVGSRRAGHGPGASPLPWGRAESVLPLDAVRGRARQGLMP